MIGWWRRFAADFKAEYARIRAEREPKHFVVGGVSSPQPIQSSVDMVVWRANNPCRTHSEFDDGCQDCHDAAHCRDHVEFDPDCVDCTSRKTLQRLGTKSHYHADPAKQAAESELGQGREIWRS